MRCYLQVMIFLGLWLLAACNVPANETTTNEETAADPTAQPTVTEAPPTATVVAPTATAVPPTDTPEPTETPLPEPTAVLQPVLFTAVNPPEQPMMARPEEGSAFDAIYTDTGAVIHHDGLFHLFYNVIQGWPPREILIGYATSPDGVNWTRHGDDEPVMRAEEVSYAGHTLLISNVRVEDDGTWVMYFYTWPIMSGTAASSIGRASALSPTGPWTADEAPALEADPDSWDNFSVANPYVVRQDEGTYFMYFTGNTKGSLDAYIGLATSADGVTWTKHDGFVLEAGDASWSERKVSAPKVWQTESGWRMIFRNDPLSGGPPSLSYATSEDGISWTMMSQETPIFDITSVPEWRAVWATDIAHLDGTYFLFAEIGTGNSTDVHVMTYEGEFGE